MKLTRDEFVSKVTELTASMGDDGLQVLENFVDTYDSMIPDPDATDWKNKYEENDAEWRRRYIERFNMPVERSQEKKGQDVRISDIFIRKD